MKRLGITIYQTAPAFLLTYALCFSVSAAQPAAGEPSPEESAAEEPVVEEPQLEAQYEEGAVQLSGEGRQLTLKANAAPIRDILGALEKHSGFAVINRTSGLDKVVSIEFTGSMEQILAQVLKRYSYLVIYQPLESKTPAPGERPNKIARVFVLDSSEHIAPTVAITDKKQAGATPAQQGGKEGREGEISSMLRSRVVTPDQSAPSPIVGQSAGDDNGQADAEPGESEAGNPQDLASDPDLQTQLAITTRQARKQVDALVKGLEQVESSISGQ